MELLVGSYYVEVKDKRYINHPTENIMLGLRKEPKSLRTHYRAQNDTEIRKNKDSSKMINVNY